MGKRLLCLLCALSLALVMMPTKAGAYEMGSAGIVQTISSGGYHSMALKTDGSLYSWGNNGTYQVGDSTQMDRNVPVKMLDHIVSVSAGENHAIAIKTDGTLWAWGNNRYGQLGIGRGLNPTTAMKVMEDVAAGSAGGSHSLAIKSDGTLWAWGSNQHGQLGDGTTDDHDKPIKVMDGVIAVSAGATHTLALKEDHTLWGWGGDDLGREHDDARGNQLTPIQVMTSVAAISASGRHSLALKTDGSVWAWGGYIQCGLADRSAGYFTLPRKVLDGVSVISAGYAHSMVIKTDGTLWAWGENYDGQLGDGSMTDTAVPVKVMDNVAAVSAGNGHTLAVTKTGTLYAWGNNDRGRLGDGTEWGQVKPVKIMEGVALPAATPEKSEAPEYTYDTVDVGETVVLPTKELEAIISGNSAAAAVVSAVNDMTEEQRNSATGADWVTLFAEEAVGRAASRKVSGQVMINAAEIEDLQAIAALTNRAVETALINGGVTTARFLSNTVCLATDEAGLVTIQIDPDVIATEADKIRVETPTFAITFKVDDIAPDLQGGKPITITVQDVGTGFAAGAKSKATTVKLNLPNGKTSNPVTISVPKGTGDTSYQVVASTEGKTVPTKHNPATGNMDAKVSQSGTYTVKTNQKDFGDIAQKSAEMQKAICYLASKGVIDGTSDKTFTPDGSISRAEIAALLMRALGKLDSKAVANFPDVKSSDWFYAAAGSSVKHGIMNGMGDGTFSGTKVIAKDQIVSVAARVLKMEMGYKSPQDQKTYLAQYSDKIATWAKDDVVLATRENLVLQRVDGTFKGSSSMTRGDACIVIYRLFNKIW